MTSLDELSRFATWAEEGLTGATSGDHGGRRDRRRSRDDLNGAWRGNGSWRRCFGEADGETLILVSRDLPRHRDVPIGLDGDLQGCVRPGDHQRVGGHGDTADAHPCIGWREVEAQADLSRQSGSDGTSGVGFRVIQ